MLMEVAVAASVDKESRLAARSPLRGREKCQDLSLPSQPLTAAESVLTVASHV